MPLPDAGHLPGGGLPAPLGYKRKSVLLRVNLTHISSPPQGWVSWAEEEGMRPWPLTWQALLLSSSLLGLFSLGLSGCEALSPCCPHLLPSTALLCPLLIIPKGTHILTQAWLPVFPHSSQAILPPEAVRVAFLDTCLLMSPLLLSLQWSAYLDQAPGKRA